MLFIRTCPVTQWGKKKGILVEVKAGSEIRDVLDRTY